MTPAKDFLFFIVSSLVSHTDEVIITETVDDRGTLLTLKVDPTDMGSIIGRGGKTIDALRLMVRIHGSKQDKKVTLRILEDQNNLK